ncbi:hypothetical protein FOA52_009826 [Chlamydomonas sp. UWO 241]|nr:hypothetical protein FOA52_009826 [Chlamydomonas sp. UWO 241]
MQPAAEPKEVAWQNLGMLLPRRSSSRVVALAAFWALSLFFMVPVSILQAAIEIDRLQSYPIIGTIASNRIVIVALEAILPGLALKLFLLIVPPLLRLLVTYAGAVSEQEVDLTVFSWLFIFQVVVVFFGSMLAGAFFNQVEQWIREPASVLSTLGAAVPAVATFFITYVGVLAFVIKPISALRPIGVAQQWLLSCMAGSPRALERIWREQYTEVGSLACGDHLITILLGLVYSCINPVIAPYCLAYFLILATYEKYLCLYVYKRHYESAGLLWPRVFNCIMAAVYIMQLTLIALLAIKKFVYSTLLIPVPIATLIFHISCLKMFDKPWHLVSLHDACALDNSDTRVYARRMEERAMIEAAAAAAAVHAGLGGSSGVVGLEERAPLLPRPRAEAERGAQAETAEARPLAGAEARSRAR